MKTFHEIPQIDLAPLFRKPNTGIFEVAEQIREAYTKVGFAYIINHEFPTQLVQAAFKASADFHALSFEEKNKIKQNKFFRGYMAMESSILKVSALFNDAKKPNQSEAFILAHEVDEDDPDFLAGTNLAGPNQWPENFPEFKTIISEYNSKMLVLAKKMVQVFSVAFGLNANTLDNYFSKPTTFLRLQYYPEQPSFIPEDQYGIAPHTDYGFLTILAQDNQGGLQVRNNLGEWIEAPPIPNTFVLNSSDMLKRLSNDTYLSTPHRVINHSGKKRYSIPFFIEPNMHASIAPLPHFCKSEPAKYDSIEYYIHLMKRIRGNYEIGA
jgi:isopenicillin N synthase-like dioxygenase